MKFAKKIQLARFVVLCGVQAGVENRRGVLYSRRCS